MKKAKFQENIQDFDLAIFRFVEHIYAVVFFANILLDDIVYLLYRTRRLDKSKKSVETEEMSPLSSEIPLTPVMDISSPILHAQPRRGADGQNGKYRK